MVLHGRADTGIQNPGRKRDSFLRVPAPETTPGSFGPNRAQLDTQAKHWQGHHGDAVSHLVELLRRWQRLSHGAEKALFLALGLRAAQQVQDGANTGDNT